MLVTAMVAKIGNVKVPVKNVSDEGIAVLWPNENLPKEGEKIEIEFNFNNSHVVRQCFVKRIWEKSLGLKFEKPLGLMNSDVSIFGESLQEIAEELGLPVNFKWYKGLRDVDLVLERDGNGSYKRIEYTQGNKIVSYEAEKGLRTGTIRGYENHNYENEFEYRAVEFDSKTNKDYFNYVLGVISASDIEDKAMIVMKLRAEMK